MVINKSVATVQITNNVNANDDSDDYDGAADDHEGEASDDDDDTARL